MTWLCRRLVVFLKCLGLRERLRVRIGSTRVEHGLVILLERILLVERVVDREEVAMDVPEEKQRLCQGLMSLLPLAVIVGSRATRGKTVNQMTIRPLNRTAML
jgi:hypothetical protein